MGIASEFRGSLIAGHKSKTSVASRQIKKDLSFDLLVKLMKQHRDCFKRYVTRSPKDELHHPSFSDIYYYCHYHIGRIGGYEWFFEDSPGTVLIYRSKSLRSVPVVELLGCEVSCGQIESIINYLDKARLIKGTDKTVVVPEDFYVFEFTAQERCWTGGRERGEITDVVEPFKAKNFKDAVRILKLWPNHWCYKDISNVKVHTHDGCLNLKNTLPKSAYREKWYADLSDYNYEVTAE